MACISAIFGRLALCMKGKSHRWHLRIPEAKDWLANLQFFFREKYIFHFYNCGLRSCFKVNLHRCIFCFLFHYDSCREAWGYKRWQMPTICKFQKKQKTLFYYLIDLARTWVQISGMCSNTYAQHFQKINWFSRMKCTFQPHRNKECRFIWKSRSYRASEKTMSRKFIS